MIKGGGRLSLVGFELFESGNHQRGFEKEGAVETTTIVRFLLVRGSGE